MCACVHVVHIAVTANILCSVRISSLVAPRQEEAFLDIDAGYKSIEGQTSTGSLHAHSQWFVQGLHQHTSLNAILDLLSKDNGDTAK